MLLFAIRAIVLKFLQRVHYQQAFLTWRYTLTHIAARRSFTVVMLESIRSRRSFVSRRSSSRRPFVSRRSSSRRPFVSRRSSSMLLAIMAPISVRSVAKSVRIRSPPPKAGRLSILLICVASFSFCSAVVRKHSAII
ncbi:hypothetical protein K440DRAFT_197216 [Wilcoxina mikolae CBS 423.85]|nr:hypothetical protein K440DRAFT_197216 [Wilcoxina mikolae CBS 423.85]